MENARIFIHPAISTCHEFSSFFSLVELVWFLAIYVLFPIRGTVFARV